MSHTFARRGTRLDPQPAPWASRDGVGAMLLLRGDRTHLQALCDRLLRVTKHLTYEPIDEYVMLTVQTIEGFSSRSPRVPAQEQVSFDYKEAAFWVAVRDPGTGHKAFLLPYVFHERTVPAGLGRELWGFAKETADIEFDDQFTSISAQVEALTWHGGSHVPALNVVCEVGSALSPVPPPLHAVQSAAKSAAQAVKSSVPGLPDGVDLYAADALSTLLGTLGIGGAAMLMLLGKKFDFLQLRQLRAPRGPDDCDLQQVVRMPVELDSKAHQALLLPPHEVRLPRWHSHPFEDDFGFALDGSGRIRAALTVRAPFAFTLHEASDIVP